MAEARETAKSLAKSKYASKVCGYLGVETAKCEKVFEKLYSNMKAVFEAVKV
jgi:hypothetical protein